VVLEVLPLLAPVACDELEGPDESLSSLLLPFSKPLDSTAFLPLAPGFARGRGIAAAFLVVVFFFVVVLAFLAAG
jgi:hypothetical protein